MQKNKIAEKKNIAWNFIRRNDLNGAILLFEEICLANKRDIEAWHVLGGLYGSLGMYEKAASCSRKAIKLNPGLAEAHDNLGIALLNLGNPEEAIESHKRALHLVPNQFQVCFNLGNAYKKAGDLNKAERYFKLAISLNKNMTGAYSNLGNTLLLLGKPAQAEKYFIKAISINPAFNGIYENLGRALLQQGKLQDAIASLRKGLEYEPTGSSIHFHLGTAYRDLGRLNESKTYLEKAIRLRPDFFEAYGVLGSIYNKQGDLEHALEVYEHMLTLKADSPDVAAAISGIYEKVGDYDNAYKVLQTVSSRHSENVNIAISLGLLGRSIAIETEAIKRIEDVLYTLRPGDLDNQIRLHNLLGYLYEKTALYDKAFEHFKISNELKPHHADIPSYVYEFNALKDVFSPGFMDKIPRSDTKSQLPVFILGMPRSGTSLVEQIISSHPIVHGAGEVDYLFDIVASLPKQSGFDIAYPECLRLMSKEDMNVVSDKYLKQLIMNSGDAARITDKMPHNFLNLGLIQLLFPNARVIHCVRDPIDTCLSCYFQDFGARHPFTNDLEDIGIYFKLYKDLMRHWKNVLTIPIMDISYEDLVQNPEKQSRKLVEFCGLNWDYKCLEFFSNNRLVNTASYYQVRQPMYKHSVGRWKNYERHLEPLKAALGP